MNDYLIQDLKTVTSYLTMVLQKPTPIRMQKTLYFMWAYYYASYGQLPIYPTCLCPAQFETLKYGPVEITLYDWQQNDPAQINNQSKSIKTFVNYFKLPNQAMNQEILTYLRDLIDQCNQTYDFQLIKRSQQDTAWKTAYTNPISHFLKNNLILDDYRMYLKESEQS